MIINFVMESVVEIGAISAMREPNDGEKFAIYYRYTMNCSASVPLILIGDRGTYKYEKRIYKPFACDIMKETGMRSLIAVY